MGKDFLTNRDNRQSEREPLLYYVKVMNEEDGSLFGFLADISQTGLMLLKDCAIEGNLGFRLYMDLETEFNLEGRLSFEAQSVWCKPDVNPAYHVIGFKFTSMAPEHVDTIKYIIEKFGFNKPVF